jgi:hypothetical protein
MLEISFIWFTFKADMPSPIVGIRHSLGAGQLYVIIKIRKVNSG